MFFVGSAPLDEDGHVNVSPKGPIDTLRVLDPNTVAYLDFIGSGAETIAHVRENGRIVIMFCAFEGPPRILRLHGRARVVAAAGYEEGPRRATAAPHEFDELAQRGGSNTSASTTRSASTASRRSTSPHPHVSKCPPRPPCSTGTTMP